MNKTRQWTVLTAVGCLAILVVGWFLAVKPQRSHASQLRTQTQSVQSSNSQLMSQIQQLKQQQKDLPAQQKLLSQIATKIPDNPALPSLIRQLSGAADGAGVDLVSLAPGAPTTTAAAGATSATSAASTAGASVATIPLTVQVKGSYFNIEQFFASIESLNRAMLVTGFSLAPGTPAGAGSGSTSSASAGAPGDLSASITAQVFESAPVGSSTAPATSTTTTGH